MTMLKRFPIHLRSRTLLIVAGGFLALTLLTFTINRLSSKNSVVVNEAGEIILKKVDYQDSSIKPSGILPDGYAVNSNSPYQPEDAEGVIVTEVVASGKPTVYISQQATPGKFKFDDFYQNISNLKELETSLGKTKYGVSERDHSWVASIEMGPEWIIVNSNTNLPETDLIQILQSLRKP